LARLFPKMDKYLSLMSGLRIHTDRRTLYGPAFLRGCRLLFATDIHLRPEMDADEIAALMASCEADLILFGGDFADDRAQALRLFRALNILKAPMGIFAVRGNNDTEAFGTAEALAEATASFGCRLLVNEAANVRISGETVQIGGLDEYKYGMPDPSRLPGGDDAYRILLSHYPIVNSGLRSDLMLCGHTHGGQFNLLGFTPYAIGFEHALGPHRVSGFGQVGSTTVLVSKGIGASRIPLRLGVRPEIHLITFDC